jgi:hypothetical protein
MIEIRTFNSENTNITLSDIQHDILPTFNSVVSKPRNPSFAQQILDRKNANEHVLSTGSSTHNHQTLDDSSQFSPTPSIQSLSKENKNHSDEIDRKITTGKKNRILDTDAVIYSTQFSFKWS